MLIDSHCHLNYKGLVEDQQAVLARAWEGGLRYFDTAPLYGYGLSETRLNHFLRDKSRDDYVISTKIGRLLRASTPEARDGIGKWPLKQILYGLVPQSLVDRARFGPNTGHPLLGAADYKLVHHAKNGRSVYSFCMCPGGTVVAATSEPGRVVTNGMSQYSRNERNANSGFVVGVEPGDYGSDHPLAGIELQRRLESAAFVAGGGDYHAPGQLLGDFMAGRASTALGSVEPSYRPGVRPTDLSTVLPAYVIAAIREALPVFGRQIPRYDDPDAVLTGVETRTSSPVRITRGKDFVSLNTGGLYPAGEGAGYAGGIMSAGVDGIEVAEALGTVAGWVPACSAVISLGKSMATARRLYRSARETAAGIVPSVANFFADSIRRRRHLTIAVSEEPRCSLVRSAIAPWLSCTARSCSWALRMPVNEPLFWRVRSIR